MYGGFCEFIKNGQIWSMNWNTNSTLILDLSKEIEISEITFIKKIQNTNNAKLIIFKR